MVALLSSLVRESPAKAVESHSDMEDVSETVRQAGNYMSLRKVLKEARLARAFGVRGSTGGHQVI